MQFRARSLWLAAVATGAVVVSGSPAAAAPTFMGLGTLPGGEADSSIAWAVSADGSVVVGQASNAAAAVAAFRWTSDSGMVYLGDLPGGLVYSYSLGVSADGLVVAGTSMSANGTVTPSLTGTEAFRWTAASGMVGLGDLPGGIFDSSARGISADGTVVIGSSTYSPSSGEAFRWTSGGGMVGLGYLAGGGASSLATAASANGSVIVGVSDSAFGQNEAFRWTAAGGMVGLGDLAGGEFHSAASGVSADGSVVVGASLSDVNHQEAFRWTLSGGMVGLGAIGGENQFDSSASAISGDGSVIVGVSDSASGSDSFIWDEANGMRSLRAVLIEELGLDLTGWTLDSARAISADGLTIVGFGTNPSGLTEAWIATIPEPSTGLLVMAGLLALVFRQRPSRALSKDAVR